MSAILNFIEQQGWSACDLALPSSPVEPRLKKVLGSAWWLSWPVHLQQACAYPGLVYQIRTLPGSGGTSFVLTALRAVQAQQATTNQKWLLGIEPPDCELNGTALSALGLSQQTFVLARPPAKQAPLLALQAVKSGLFAGISVDLTYESASRYWRTPSRRLLLAARDTQTMVWLQTHRSEKQGNPLWSHVKIDLEVTSQKLCVEIKKHKHGKAPWRGEINHPAYDEFLRYQQVFCDVKS